MRLVDVISFIVKEEVCTQGENRFPSDASYLCFK